MNVVNFIYEPSESLRVVCPIPFPKVCSPTRTAPFRSRRAEENISAADAGEPLTTTAMGLPETNGSIFAVLVSVDFLPSIVIMVSPFLTSISTIEQTDSSSPPGSLRTSKTYPLTPAFSSSVNASLSSETEFVPN